MIILMIDDEIKLREKVNKYLTLKGYQVLEAGTGEEGLEILKKQNVDLILLDLRMPGMNGLTCLKEIKESSWLGEVIMISAHGEISDAVEAMKLGAYDYLTKPFRLDDLLGKMQKVEERIRSQKEIPKVDGQVISRHDDHKTKGQSRSQRKSDQFVGERVERLARSGFVFASSVMQEILDAIERVAPSDVPVLLFGETGVGKEVVAQSIHDLSGREGEFIAINCGAIPENLLESELFGYEKGAFSGAHQRKLGKLELAQRGTVFLDEIGELPKGMQVKLLRVLQEKELERVGGTQRIPLDIRVVAATNRNLQVEMAEGRFREDLYYRLNVITFKILPLCERKEDILPLAEHFVGEMNRKFGKQTRLSDPAKEQLMRYDYPGNVRELKNIIERSMVLSKGDDLKVFFETGLEMFGGISKSGQGEATMERIAPEQRIFKQEMTLEELEVMRIREALAKHKGNRTRAAKELGVSRRTIINKIKQFQLE